MHRGRNEDIKLLKAFNYFICDKMLVCWIFLEHYISRTLIFCRVM